MIHNKSDRHRKRWPKHRFLGVILVLSITSLLLSGCEEKQEEIPVLLDPVKINMDTETVKMDTLYSMKIYDASIVPYTEGLYSEYEFEVDEIKVGIGDRVKKGQVLISSERSEASEKYTNLKKDIDYTEQINSYTNAQAEGDIKIAQLELAQLEEEGNEKDIQLKKLNITELELQYQHNKQLQQLELSKKFDQLSMLEEELDYPDFIAPYDGTIIDLSKIRKGDILQPFEPVIYIADDSRLSIKADFIPENTIDLADRIYALIDEKEYDITYIPYTDDELMYRVLKDLTLDTIFTFNDTISLNSGTYVNICVLSNYVKNVLTIPIKAINREVGKSYVFKLVDGERVRQEVETGKTNGIKAQIISGLKEGDEVYVP